MGKKKHKVELQIIFYSEANNGGKAHRELDELLLGKGYKIEKFKHYLVE